MGTLDVLTELVLEVVFFDVVLLTFFDVETGLEEVVVFFRLLLTFAVVVGFLLDEVVFLMLDDFALLVAFFTICIFLVVLTFLVEVTFLVVLAFLIEVTFFELVFNVLVFFALDVFPLEIARSSRSRFLMPPLAVAELDVKSANPVDDAVLLALITVVFENKVSFEKVVTFDEGWDVGCSLALDDDTEAMIEDAEEPAVELAAVSDMETSAAEVDDDTIVELELVSDVDTNATVEDEDGAVVEFEVVSDIDADTVVEDEDRPRLELKAVSDAEEEPDAVPKMPFARRLPSAELLELNMDFMLEELEVGRLDNEDELD